MEFEFKKLNKLRETRKNQSIMIRNNFPDKIPVICERDPKSNLPDLDKHKYLFPKDLTVSQFNNMIRRKLEINDIDPLYFIVNGKDFMQGDFFLSDIYDKYKDYQDELLYISYTDNPKWL